MNWLKALLGAKTYPPCTCCGLDDGDTYAVNVSTDEWICEAGRARGWDMLDDGTIVQGAAA